MKKERDKNEKIFFYKVQIDRLTERKYVRMKKERDKNVKKCVEEGLNMFWVAI
jgi:hypothetical protein